jgi:hypothetical protein
MQADALCDLTSSMRWGGCCQRLFLSCSFSNSCRIATERPWQVSVAVWTSSLLSLACRDPDEHFQRVRSVNASRVGRGRREYGACQIVRDIPTSKKDHRCLFRGRSISRQHFLGAHSVRTAAVIRVTIQMAAHNFYPPQVAVLSLRAVAVEGRGRI